MFVLFPRTSFLLELGRFVDSPEEEFRKFIKKLRKHSDKYDSFTDGIYSSLNSSLHLLNTDGYMKL